MKIRNAMKYKFFDHTADVLFEAEGKTLDELFTACALATEETQVKLETVEPKEKITIKLEKDNVEMLLFEFLQDIIFYKDAEEILFSKFDVKINGNKLEANCFGEKITPSKHDLNVDVKAVTLHQFEVKKTQRGWKARVILDI